MKVAEKIDEAVQTTITSGLNPNFGMNRRMRKVTHHIPAVNCIPDAVPGRKVAMINLLISMNGQTKFTRGMK